MKRTLQFCWLVALALAGCLRPQPTMKAQNEPDGPPEPSWCCVGGFCSEVPHCNAGPIENCAGTCHYTPLACYLECKPE